MKNSPLNYIDPSGHKAATLAGSSPRQITESGISLFGGEKRKRREEQKATALEALNQAMEAAGDKGYSKECVINIVRYTLFELGMDPDRVRGKIENWLLPMECEAEDFQNRVREYLYYLYGTNEIPNTEEVYQVTLTVYNILADQVIRGYSLNDVLNDEIDKVFKDYFAARVQAAQLLAGIVSVIAVEAARHWLSQQKIYNRLTNAETINSEIPSGSKGLVKEGLGEISGKEYSVTEKGVEAIKDYLTEQGFIDDYENQAMIARLEKALAEGQKITGADAVYYTHELMESELVSSGMEQSLAHETALQHYGVSPYSVYHPDVIKMEPDWWNHNWFDFWGIER